MLKSYILVLTIIIMSSALYSQSNNSLPWPNVQPPIAEIKPYQRILHEDTITDNYYWMIDYFKKGPDSSAIVEYLAAENEYLDTMMSGVKTLREKLFIEMKSRIKEKDESIPYFKNGYYYYTRTEDGKQYYKFCRKKGSLDAPEEVLLDIDEMAAEHPYYSVSRFAISDNNNFLAFSVDTVSRRQYAIYVKDLTTGKIFYDGIGGTSGDPVWAADNKTIFYTSNNSETLLSEKIKKHVLHTNVSEDSTVYNETDKTNYIGISKSNSGKYIFIYSGGTLSSEIRYLNAFTPDKPFKIFQPRIKEVLYQVFAIEDKFLVLTNKDAINFKLMETPLDATEIDNWKEKIPHRTDVLLSGVDEFKDFIVLTERKNGLIQIRIQNLISGNEHYLDFGEPAYAAYVSNNPEYNSQMLRFGYTSLTTPNSVYDYNMVTRDKELKKQQEIVGGYNPKEYVTERIYVTARDGVKIPVSLVYKKGFDKNGNAPLLLYGYGSYGASMDATFSTSRLSLLNRGFCYAIAHIRGGEEMGRKWYEEGKMMKKKNTFNDFIDCADYLISENYTSKQHLYAIGGSAGGLLMGAVVNMRPDLWNGIIAAVPFVDVVNTMLDVSIPLTTNEFDEWGNPVNKEAYEYIKSYSPYENVEKKAYPNMLVTTGLHDSQVQYFEPAKWVAKLRMLNTSNNVILLHTNMDFGHGGASGRFDYLKDIALQYAFLFSLEGITN